MKLTIAFFEEGEHWVAQCLEVDVAAQARGRSDIFMAIGETLAAHVVVAGELGRAPFQFLPPCPDDVWQKCVKRAEAIRAEIKGTEAE
jgi:hypothetical protein